MTVMTRPGGVGTLTSGDAVLGACRVAVADAVDRIVRQRLLMRDWVARGLIDAKWGRWLEGER